MKCCMKQLMQHFIRVYTVCKGKKDLQTKEYIFKKTIVGHPRYVQWTIPSLLYHTRRNNPLVYKGLSIELFSSILVIGTLRVNNLLHNLTYDNFAYWVIFYDSYGISGTLSLRVKQFGIDQTHAWIQKVLSFYDGQADKSIPP